MTLQSKVKVKYTQKLSYSLLRKLLFHFPLESVHIRYSDCIWYINGNENFRSPIRSQSQMSNLNILVFKSFYGL